MRIDLLKPMVPREYKFRQKVLDTMFGIAKSNPKPTCHQDEIIKSTKARKEKIETVILYLVRNEYAKHVGDHGEPLYALTGKGQSASIDREFFRIGRTETYKTLGLYFLIGTAIAGVVEFGLSKRANPIEAPMPQIKETPSQQILPIESIQEEKRQDHQSDSASSVTDSAMLRNVVNEKTNP